MFCKIYLEKYSVHGYHNIHTGIKKKNELEARQHIFVNNGQEVIKKIIITENVEHNTCFIG